VSAAADAGVTAADPVARPARTARAAATAVARVAALLEERAPAAEVRAAVDVATGLVDRLVGWPSHDALARLLATASCPLRGGPHAEALAEARRAVTAALGFDGFLPQPEPAAVAGRRPRRDGTAV
jgi:hypothetical protein